jgi:hypothetical protein
LLKTKSIVYRCTYNLLYTTGRLRKNIHLENSLAPRYKDILLTKLLSKLAQNSSGYGLQKIELYNNAKKDKDE